MTNYSKTCIECKAEYTTTSAKSLVCSATCRQRRANNSTRAKKQAKVVANHTEDKLMPTCLFCGWKAFSLTTHIRYEHEMTPTEYMEHHSTGIESVNHPHETERRSNRLKGENNPGYQHSGTMSTYSKNCITYNGLTDEEKAKRISAQVKKLTTTREQNNNNTTTLEYYTSRGMSMEEARAALSDRQTTFSLDICIEKYGHTEGLKVWSERQKKWKQSLDALPEEEKERIHRAKIAALSNSYSMISTQLFEQLNTPNAKFGANEQLVLTPTGYFKPDFLIGTKIIEFYGDFWHANPIKYQAGDVISVKYHTKTVQDIWDRDNKRIAALQQAGYQTLIVWERDYKQRPEETIQKCLDFLNN
jgi:G:T-mismatch repair DNA endonuclease (very short patch repair protein)